MERCHREREGLGVFVYIQAMRSYQTCLSFRVQCQERGASSLCLAMKLLSRCQDFAENIGPQDPIISPSKIKRGMRSYTNYMQVELE